jgi:flagellar hook-associated protein 2
MVIDTSQANISFEETARAQDALLAVGTSGFTGKSTLVSSRTNTFNNVLSGATLTIEDVWNQPVTVKVATSNTDVTANIKTLVDNYNAFRDKLKSNTAYDSTNDVTSPMTGDFAALQLDIDMSDLVSGSYLGAGKFQSLAEIGVSINEDGTLALNTTKLDEMLATNRDAVQQLFTAADTGVSARFAKVIERLAGPDESLLELRKVSLQDTIDYNQTRIDDMATQLDAQKTRLLTQFYQMELNLAKMQSNLKALDSIQWMLTSSTSSSSSNSLFSSSSS